MLLYLRGTTHLIQNTFFQFEGALRDDFVADDILANISALNERQ